MMRWLRLGRFATAWWLTALVASALVIAIQISGAIERLDGAAYDFAQGFQHREPDSRILLVTIDDESLAELGKWPWPRSIHARLIDRLAAGAPTAILYDVLFLEPGPDDALVAAAMASAGNVYIPLLLGQPETGSHAYTPIMPVPPISAAAAGLGHVNLMKDADGVARRVRLVERGDDADYPHLVAAPAHLLVSSDYIDRMAAQPYLIPYAGPAGTFRSISAAAILKGETPANLLKNRLIIVGATAQGLGDRHLMANSAKDLISGTELQANLLDGLLRKITLTEAARPARILFSLIPLWLMLVGFRALKPSYTLPALLLLSLASIGTSILTLLSFDLWLPPMTAIIGLVFAYPFWAWRRLAAVSRHMMNELDRLRSDSDLPSPFAGSAMTDDPIMRETTMLSDAVSELRSMRHFLSQSLDQLPDAVFVTDKEGHVTLQNQRATAFAAAGSGSSEAAEIGGILEKLSSFAGSKAPSLWPPTDNELALELQSREGKMFDVRITKYLNSRGEFEGWIVRLSDISDIRIAQRQRDEMLDFLTHDMRSPQIAILALTGAAEDRDIEPQLAERIDHYARRTLDLADDIVHLARARTLSYKPIPLDLATILVEAIEELWPQIKARNISVEKYGLDETEYLVGGEPTLLLRALINLVDNAVKYGREGGNIRCGIARRGDGATREVHLLVSDDGIGIPESRLAGMFERFQRGVVPRTTGGAGLGLSFVHTVVARHGGRIICESKLGSGSTFNIILPLLA